MSLVLIAKAEQEGFIRDFKIKGRGEEGKKGFKSHTSC